MLQLFLADHLLLYRSQKLQHYDPTRQLRPSSRRCRPRSPRKELTRTPAPARSLCPPKAHLHQDSTRASLPTDDHRKTPRRRSLAPSTNNVARSPPLNHLPSLLRHTPPLRTHLQGSPACTELENGHTRARPRSATDPTEAVRSHRRRPTTLRRRRVRASTDDLVLHLETTTPMGDSPLTTTTLNIISKTLLRLSLPLPPPTTTRTLPLVDRHHRPPTLVALFLQHQTRPLRSWADNCPSPTRRAQTARSLRHEQTARQVTPTCLLLFLRTTRGTALAEVLPATPAVSSHQATRCIVRAPLRASGHKARTTACRASSSPRNVRGRRHLTVQQRTTTRRLRRPSRASTRRRRPCRRRCAPRCSCNRRTDSGRV